MAAGFSYTDYYQATLVLERLLKTHDTPSWLTAPPREVRKTKNLVYLGCNILKTVHLVETLCMVLDVLGVEYVAVGGPAFCCGTVPRGKGDLKMAEGMFGRTVAQFQRFDPESLVHWCPSCEAEFAVMAARNPLSCRQIHFTELLLQALQRRKLPVEVPRRVALHYHGGNDRAEAESQRALEILRLIPGLDPIPFTAPAALGTHCSSQGAIRALGLDGYRRVVEAEFEQAAAAGCDGIVTVYHSCHRELCKARHGSGVGVVNYLTLVAQSLGLDAPEDKFQRLAGEPLESVLAQVMPVAERWGLKRDLVERVVREQLAIG